MRCTRSRGSRGFQCLVCSPRPGERGRYAAGTLKRIEHPTAQKHRRGQRLEGRTRIRCLDSVLDRYLAGHILDRDIAQFVTVVSMVALRN